jgi:hypothetical protein
MKFILFILSCFFLLSCGDNASKNATQSNQDTSNKNNTEDLQLIDIEEPYQPGNTTEVYRGDEAKERVRLLIEDSAQ